MAQRNIALLHDDRGMPDLREQAPRSQTAVNALVHLYRGELGRLTAYRSRMDTPTNWAISSAAVVTTFALGTVDRTHAAFLFLMFLTTFFLQLEARRFLSYDVSRQRVLLLERYFFPELMGAPVDTAWPDRLVSALQNPCPSVNWIEAVGWRLRRSYLWLYAAILLAWLGKLHTSVSGEAHSDLVQRAAIGAIPGEAVFAVVIVVYLALVAMALLTQHRDPPLEERRQVHTPLKPGE